MEKQFKGNLAFNAKYETEILNLQNSLDKVFTADIHKGFHDDDSFHDTTLHIKSENCICKHSCIIKTLAPTLIPLFDEQENGNENPVIIADQHLTDSSKQKQKLLAVYQTFNNSTCDIGIRNLIAEDFRRLLEDGCYSDIVIELDDKVQFNCHKCILLSRCEYFSMMLCGNWIEKEKGVIVLKSRTSKVCKIILNFIYTADAKLPLDIDLNSINELIQAEDMYDIKGLKDVIKQHLRCHYLHFFHVPCTFCIDGFIDVRNMLSKTYVLGYDDILENCHTWVAKYYAKIFSNRNFARATNELRHIVMCEIKESVNSVNIIVHLKNCKKLKSCLPNVKWGNKVKELVNDIESYCMKFVCDNFSTVTNLPGFTFCLFQQKDIQNSKMLQDIFILSLKEHLSVKNALGIWLRGKELGCQLKLLRDSEYPIHDSEEFVDELLLLSRKFIRSHIMHLQRTKEWKELNSDAKKQLKADSGFIDVSMNDLKIQKR